MTGAQLAATLMRGFASATGLSGAARPERYLWTDAFAVCNFLGLYRRTGDGEYLELALRLTDQVHHVLGRHRDGDPRQGWISGLDEAEGERHPTRGGLRIGKPLPERQPGEPFDPLEEWDRDGQYLHYLTQWMHALHRVAQETGNHLFTDWAIELAQAAHAAFARRDAKLPGARLVWKMSIDLRRVLVSSTGQHDALDALTSYLEIQSDRSELERELREARDLCSAGTFETEDALGIGVLLTDAYRIAAPNRRDRSPERALLAKLLIAARHSLDLFMRADSLSAPARSRLAFRELGLAIGLHAMQRLLDAADSQSGIHEALAGLADCVPLATRIDGFWAGAEHRAVSSWTAHRHINDVMLAASLLPDGYLGP